FTTPSRSSLATTIGSPENKWPLALTRSAFAVAAIAERIAFLRSFAFTFSVLSVWGFGGWALRPPLAWGTRAARLPFRILGTRETPRPVPQERAEVLRPARSLGP